MTANVGERMRRRLHDATEAIHITRGMIEELACDVERCGRSDLLSKVRDDLDQRLMVIEGCIEATRMCLQQVRRTYDRHNVPPPLPRTVRQ